MTTQFSFRQGLWEGGSKGARHVRIKKTRDSGTRFEGSTSTPGSRKTRGAEAHPVCGPPISETKLERSFP
jgi:hypothetical protein